MKPKKNPKFDVSKKSSLYFSVALLLSLSFAYLAINYKTSFVKELVDLTSYIEPEEEIFKIPVIVEVAPKLSKPIPLQTKFVNKVTEIDNKDKVVEQKLFKPNDLDTKTSEKTSTSPTENEPDLIGLEGLEPPVVDVYIPFSIIEQVPVFPGCEKKKTNEERKQCMSAKIKRIVNKKFNSNLAADYGLEGRLRVNVMFTINSDGHISNIEVRGPHPALENEAKRVVGFIPEMKPGKQRGKSVPVSYSMPILFDVR